MSCIYVIIGLYAFVLNFVIAGAVFDICEPYFGNLSIIFTFGSFFGIPAVIFFALICRDDAKDFKELEKKYSKLKDEYNISKNNIPKYEYEAHRRNEIIATLNNHKQRLEKEVLENKILISDLKEENWHLQELNNVINFKIKDIPILVSIWKEIEYGKQDIISRYLDEKLHSQPKVIDEVIALSREKQYWLLKSKELQYKCALYESIVPSISDFVDDEVTKDMTIYRVIKNEYLITNDDRFSSDEARRYLSEEEYCTLPNVEKYQKALENWYYRRLKTKITLRKDFEQYVKYHIEQLGYKISYFKDNNLYDFGNILICNGHRKIHIVQCKYWNTKKQIHENDLSQLLCITAKYCIQLINDAEFEINSIAKGYTSPYAMIADGKIVPFLATSTTLTKEAKKFAISLEIKFQENMSLGLYPMIKCFKKGNDNLYLLPFDKQYKNIDISKTNGFMALTTKEAEQAGFKRGMPYIF